MDVFLLWVLCFVRHKPLRRADHSSRGILPNVVYRVWSRNLVNEETMAHCGVGGGDCRATRKKKCWLSRQCRVYIQLDALNSNWFIEQITTVITSKHQALIVSSMVINICRAQFAKVGNRIPDIFKLVWLMTFLGEGCQIGRLCYPYCISIVALNTAVK